MSGKAPTDEWAAVRAECAAEFPDVKFRHIDIGPDDDPDILLIRERLALPMEKRTNFLRGRTKDGVGSYL